MNNWIYYFISNKLLLLFKLWLRAVWIWKRFKTTAFSCGRWWNISVRFNINVSTWYLYRMIVWRLEDFFFFFWWAMLCYWIGGKGCFFGTILEIKVNSVVGDIGKYWVYMRLWKLYVTTLNWGNLGMRLVFEIVQHPATHRCAS